MTYAYARVSTSSQNTARQIDSFALVEGIDKIFEEHGSGKDFEHRPVYQRLRRSLRKGDTLIVLSLDRFGRNYDEIIEEWRRFRKVGVHVRVLDMPILNTSSSDLVQQFLADLVLQVLSFVAHQERVKINERQAQGIAAARARGVKFGRPIVKIPDGFGEVCAKYMSGGISITSAADEVGMCRSTFHRYLKSFQSNKGERT